MIRLKRDVGFILNEISIDCSEKVFEESYADKSQFRPNVDSAHLGSSLGGTKPVYEFNDGKDNGLRMYVMRDVGSDVTEIAQAESLVKARIQDMADDITAGEKERAENERFNALIDSVAKAKEVTQNEGSNKKGSDGIA